MAAKKLFTLTLSPDSARNKRPVEILDQSGIDYRVVEAPIGNSGRKRPPTAKSLEKLPQLKCGGDVLDDLTRRSLVDFLWAHGAQFEDS